MTYSLNDLTLEEIDILALAMDFFMCNGDIPETLKNSVEDLFINLDLMSEDIHDSNSKRKLLEKQNNILIVDFSPKTI